MTQEGVFLFLFVSTKHAKFISNVPFSIFFFELLLITALTLPF